MVVAGNQTALDDSLIDHLEDTPAYAVLKQAGIAYTLTRVSRLSLSFSNALFVQVSFAPSFDEKELTTSSLALI